jgi:hypothetical protein
MKLIRQRTSVPVPEVFAYMEKGDSTNPTISAWMLMEYIPANTAMDEWGGYPVHHGISPDAKYFNKFNSVLADYAVQISSLRFPKIGAIRFVDNRFEVGPVPGWGDPWDTAADFFQAISDKYKNEYVEPRRERLYASQLTQAEGDRLVESYHDFLPKLVDLARRMPFHKGPFPLIHGNMWNRDVLVDTECNALGLIGWGRAMTVPWEVAEFSSEMLRCGSNLPGVSAPSKSTLTTTALEGFGTMMVQTEVVRGLDHDVSAHQSDKRVRMLAHAFEVRIRRFAEGDYSAVLDLFNEKMLEAPTA